MSEISVTLFFVAIESRGYRCVDFIKLKIDPTATTYDDYTVFLGN